MTTVTKTQFNKVATMQDLLQAVLEGGNKTAAAPNPPTSGPGGGPMDGETHYTEGERSKEHEAHNRETFGATGADTPTNPDAATGELEIPPNAAPIKPTGEDPENESNHKGPVKNVEPGTSLEGTKVDSKTASLSEKYAAWREKAASVCVSLVGDHDKLSSVFSGEMGETIKTKSAAAAAPAEADAPADDADDSMHPIEYVAGGDEAMAKEAHDLITRQITEARMYGVQAADKVAAYLDLFSEEQTKQAATKDKPKAKPVVKTATVKRAMEGMVPPAGGGEMIPPEAMAGGGEGEMMPPEGEMGGEGMSPEEDPELIAQALTELANEMGMPPEQLAQMVIEEMQGAGGEGGMPVEEEMPAEGGDGGGMSEGAAMPEEESAPMPPKEALAKHAAAKQRVKKHAMAIVGEIARRGQR